MEREAIELHTNTAYDRPVIRQEIINIHGNTAYGQKNNVNTLLLEKNIHFSSMKVCVFCVW